MPFNKILIANRGEIALRIIRACKELDIKSVAVYSTADANSLHVAYADSAICIGPPNISDSYLSLPNIISAAETSSADAIHPGIGFLAESHIFASACRDHNIAFIGPTPELIQLLGDKANARNIFAKAGIEPIPGSKGIVKDEKSAIKIAVNLDILLLLNLPLVVVVSVLEKLIMTIP